MLILAVMNIIFIKNNKSLETDQQIEKFGTELVTAENNVSVYSLSGFLAEQGLYNGIKFSRQIKDGLFTRLKTFFWVTFSSADIIHVFGEDYAWPIAFWRLIKPRTKIILNIDSKSIEDYGFMNHLSGTIIKKMSHKMITSREIDLRHYRLSELDLEYIPHPIYPQRMALDSIILRAHRLSAQKYILALVDPENKQDIDILVQTWQNVLSKNMPNVKLAIGFTKQVINQELAVDHSIVWLGYLRGETADMIFAGARAVIIPNLRDYHYQALRAFSYGKMTYPVQELRDQSAILYHDLYAYIGDEALELHQLNDEVHCMSLGHLVREAVESRHNPKNTIHKLENIYERLILADGEVYIIRG